MPKAGAAVVVLPKPPNPVVAGVAVVEPNVEAPKGEAAVVLAPKSPVPPVVGCGAPNIVLPVAGVVEAIPKGVDDVVLAPNILGVLPKVLVVDGAPNVD